MRVEILPFMHGFIHDTTHYLRLNSNVLKQKSKQSITKSKRIGTDYANFFTEFLVLFVTDELLRWISTKSFLNNLQKHLSNRLLKAFQMAILQPITKFSASKSFILQVIHVVWIIPLQRSQSRPTRFCLEHSTRILERFLLKEVLILYCLYNVRRVDVSCFAKKTWAAEHNIVRCFLCS